MLISSFSLFVSGVFTWLFLGFLVPILSQNILDSPKSRSSHKRPIPRGGGIAFVLVGCVTSLLECFFSQVSFCVTPMLFSIPLAVVGLIDDKFDLPSSWRYGVQLITAFLLLSMSPLIYPLVVSFGGANLLSFCFYSLLLIAVTAVINFTNFMDGLDGLISGCMAVAIAALAVALPSPWPVWALVGSLLGFLLWNWSPAKVFMGDIGSTFLGATFSGLVLQASSWSEAFSYLLLATPLLGDACFCLIRRFLAGQPIFQAHRLHLFQRLNQAGWSHGSVSVIYISATIMMAVALLAGGLLWVFFLSFLELLAGVWLDQKVAVPFLVESRN